MGGSGQRRGNCGHNPKNNPNEEELDDKDPIPVLLFFYSGKMQVSY